MTGPRSGRGVSHDGSTLPKPGEDEGNPPPAWDVIPPGIGQLMEYLIRRGRYASCIHAGGLSCWRVFLESEVKLGKKGKTILLRDRKRGTTHR